MGSRNVSIVRTYRGGREGERSPLLARLLEDPPLVHPKCGEDRASQGLTVFRTDVECYRLLESAVFPGAATLETGLGLSTALFALRRTVHTCLAFHAQEVLRFRAYCSARAIDLASVRFEVGGSDDLLPAMEIPELDVLLVDGGHGFPTPILDWYYAGRRLKDGGLLILDDLSLAAPRILADFLERDPRWERIRRSWKWAAYIRRSSGPLLEDWSAQPFLKRHIPLRHRIRYAGAALLKPFSRP